jgi:hypothetical protein
MIATVNLRVFGIANFMGRSLVTESGGRKGSSFGARDETLIKQLRGFAPSFSSQVRFGEPGAPVPPTFCETERETAVARDDKGGGGVDA